MILEKVKAIFEKLKGYFTGIFNYEGDFSQSTFGTQTKKVQESKSLLILSIQGSKSQRGLFDFKL